VFGSEGSIDTLLESAAVNSVTRTVSFSADNGHTLEVEFRSDSELMLTLKDNGGNAVQTIDVNAAQGTTFMDLSNGVDEDAARELLKNIIKDGGM
jgi:hypothetical protein